MNQTAGVEFERRVAEAIKQLNYIVTTDPLERPQPRETLNKLGRAFFCGFASVVRLAGPLSGHHHPCGQASVAGI